MHLHILYVISLLTYYTVHLYIYIYISAAQPSGTPARSPRAFDLRVINTDYYYYYYIYIYIYIYM